MRELPGELTRVHRRSLRELAQACRRRPRGVVGAFLGGRMCAGLGLYTDGDGVARYQAVDTHPDHRRRGLAGTLVHHAGAEGLSWPGVRTLVILADPQDDAIRVYRSVGFDGTETQVQLLRKPPGEAEELSPVSL